jgi:predicted DNA-binding transcriptional regulator AlpA
MEPHTTRHRTAARDGLPRNVIDRAGNVSWKALDWATDSEAGSSTTKFILFLLANKADANFSYQPSISTTDGRTRCRPRHGHASAQGAGSQRFNHAGVRSSTIPEPRDPAAAHRCGHTRSAEMYPNSIQEEVKELENNVFDQLPLLLAVPRAAAILGISRAAAYRLAASGELPVRRLGGRVYVVTAELRELVAS